MLKQLFLILIDNAVKYTQKNGEVTITLSRVDGTATIRVRDTGIGIACDDLTHIFDRFYRADKSRSRKSGGSGLGLSIGRWIAEAHGGSIQVESALGAGSTFQVALPVARDSMN
ncbi:MAG TPA: sensor histidine kinase [Candidatus Angelobacter sp.]|nr:sensor histidine kinase [Candidatus Angelobacter sp.]